jgi:hypothetical protein
VIPVDCGRPSAPVSARRDDGAWPCHCGTALNVEAALPTTFFPTSPGPVTHCRGCGCHVALVGPDWRAGDAPPPTSAEECVRRMAANRRLEGYGPDVRAVEACPFCGAADFVVLRIADVVNGPFPREDGLCRSCGRSARFEVRPAGSGVEVELTQTGGPPPPDWYRPAPRRAGRGDGG